MCQIQEMAAGGATKAVHRLRVVADDREPSSVRPQPCDDVDLNLIDVLIFVDEDMVPPPGQSLLDDGLGEQCSPGEQQVVEVHQSASAFAGDEVLQ